MLSTESSSWTGINFPDVNSWSDGSQLSSSYNFTDIINNEIVCIAVDIGAGKMWVRQNEDAWYTTGSAGDPATGANPTMTFTTGKIFTWCTFAGFDEAGGTDVNLTNFGQKAFTHAAPTGFLATHTANLPAPTISKPSNFHAPIVYTGNATDDTAIAVGFQPDFVLIKNTSQNDNWKLIDSVRGATKNIGIENDSNQPVVETTEATGLKAFTTTGFTLGTSG